MSDDDLSRRTVLNHSEGDFGSLSTDERDGSVGSGRVNVGIRSEQSERKVMSHSSKVDRVFEWEGDRKTISGQFSEAAIERFREDPDVRYVERDGTMEALGQSLPWGVDRVDADLTHRKTSTDSANGAHVAILDSGIDSDHPDLEGCLGEGKAFTPCKKGPNECHEDWDDDNGHGTHCAGIVNAQNDEDGLVGVSADATLHAVKVLGGRGGGRFSTVAAGIRWVADQGYGVANMSLGGPKSFIVEDAVEYAYSKGVLLVAAAGNSGPCTDCVGYPAREPEVIAVSATARGDSLATFSSTGPQVDLAAPGEDINSTYTGGGYGRLNGTSMACPHVAGAAAELVSNGLSNRQARVRLEESAEDISLDPNEQGHGLLDVAAALGKDNSNEERTGRGRDDRSDDEDRRDRGRGDGGDDGGGDGSGGDGGRRSRGRGSDDSGGERENR